MNIVPLELELKRIQQLSIDCEEANIEENDHTVHSYDDLEYEYGLAKESVTKKLGFLENQVCSEAPLISPPPSEHSLTPPRSSPAT